MKTATGLYLFTIYNSLFTVLSLHRRKKLGIRLCLAETLKDDFHLLHRREWVEYAAHYPDSGKVFFVDKQFLFSSARTLEVDCRK